MSEVIHFTQSSQPKTIAHIHTNQSSINTIMTSVTDDNKEIQTLIEKIHIYFQMLSFAVLFRQIQEQAI